MRAIVVLFTRDLRVRDHPALAAAARDAERVVPLFVHDERIRAAGFVRPNRAAFLLECLADLGDALHQRGAPLVTRQGDVVHETMRVADAAGAEAVYLSADISAYAAARERRLRDACAATRRALVSFPGVTIVPPGELRPGGGDHFRVFTHYWRRWAEAPRRPLERAPARLTAVADVAPGCSPARAALAPGSTSPDLPPGGAGAGERRLEAWLRRGLAGYAERHDVLDDNGTSRLSPYLHFGCVSPLAVAERAVGRPGGDAFVRQLCWRDFHHQVHAATPSLPRVDYRPRNRDRKRESASSPHPPHPRADDAEAALARWREGRTGYPVVDAGRRQLAREGWMHNRARLMWRRFSPRISAWTGATAPPTSGLCSWTAILPTTPATGSGSRARGTTRARTASST